MCYPMIIMAVGAVVSAAAAVKQGQAAKAAGDAQAAMSRRQADDAQERGEIEAAKVRRQGAQKKSAQTVRMAANGIVIDADESSGSLLADTEMITELDALTSTNNADKESFLHEYSARNSQMKGGAAQQSGYLSAAGTLLSSAGSMGSSYSKFSKDPNNAGQGFGDFMLS